MSSDLYLTRLYWDDHDGHGCAKTPGIYRNLTVCPSIRGIRSHPTHLDYAPETHTALIFGAGELKERDMTEKEQDAAELYLHSLLTTAP